MTPSPQEAFRQLVRQASASVSLFAEPSSHCSFGSGKALPQRVLVLFVSLVSLTKASAEELGLVWFVALFSSEQPLSSDTMHTTQKHKIQGLWVGIEIRRIMRSF